MKSRVIAERSFDMEDQRRFAALSGDWNPIHVDPIAARRTIAGEPIVHGCHTVLWALESVFGTDPAPMLGRIDAVFQRPLYLDTKVTASVSEHDDHSAISINTGEIAVARVSLYADTAQPLSIAVRNFQDAAPTERSEPEQPSFDTIRQWTGEIDLSFNHELASQLFPNLHKQGPGFIALFCALSRTVGMECPGLRSLFSRLSVNAGGPDSALAGRIAAASREIAPVQLQLEGEGISCNVDAFYRPGPVRQPSISDIAEHVAPDAYADVAALVIGGSRGLGEVTAKLIAAGGGKVVVTYGVGSADAARVAADITEAGAHAQILQLNVLDPMPAFAQLEDLGVRITDMFYFASPRISGRRSASFDASLYELFSTFYVTAFAQCIQSALTLAPHGLRALYPSTVFLDAPPRDEIEYVAAKAAGESLALSLQRQHRDLSVCIERLPRTATDQTSTILGGGAVSAVGVMAPVLERMIARGDSRQ